MRRILIAEDEPAIRRLIVSLLRREGFQPVEASNGVEAIDALKHESFDLALIDLMMPLVSGYRVLDVIRAEHPALRCIIVTAAGEVGLGMLPPNVPVIRKPFDPEELMGVVRATLAAASHPEVEA